jgi:hypothetical protein
VSHLVDGSCNVHHLLLLDLLLDNVYADEGPSATNTSTIIMAIDFKKSSMHTWVEKCRY